MSKTGLRYCVAVAACVVICASTSGDIFTPLTSYEPAETDLTVSSGDAGLSVSLVEGGVGGAPAATDGGYVLRLDISGEADRKVEFRHNWAASTYDLAGEDELLADVYIASLGALPTVVGIFSTNWNPPDAWQPASGIPSLIGVWTTVSFDVSTRAQIGLDFIWAFVLENLAGTSGVIFVDNLRFRRAGGVESPAGVAANGYTDRNEILWREVNPFGLQGYNVYRSETAIGPYTQLNALPVINPVYRDPISAGDPRYFYQVTAVVDGQESSPSSFATALYNGITDEQMLDMVQAATFGYFWDGAHPISGMALEGIGLGHSPDTVATGGTGMGLMTIVVGAERGFVSRSAAAARVLTILTFLDETVARYHGAWAHHYNGATGATIPFAGPADDGGDLVETSFLVQGILTVRQYFDDPVDPGEIEIRDRATSMWEGVEWDWYRRFAGGNVLYWHWSPNFGWQLNFQIRGYHEAMMVYLLAVASPTHPMPAASFNQGWAGLSSYTNSNTYFGFRQWVGPPLGGPLFFTHYSNLGFDPRYKRDAFANYFLNSRNISLINRAHCVDNPGEFEGHSPLLWGLSASNDPWGYSAHSPTNDNGTITPTAALSAMPYTPVESLATLRHMFDMYGADIFGTYGFVDALNLGEDWFAPGYLAIDQGPIAPMIENYRTGLCWKLFMSNPEIAPMMQAIGMFHEVDFDTDGDVDALDMLTFIGCHSGPEITTPPGGCPQSIFDDADLDNDFDVDMHDVAILQMLANAP